MNQMKVKAHSRSAEVLESFKKDLELIYNESVTCSRVMKSDTGDQYFLLATAFVEEPRQ
jgi:hypothetical protein